MVNCSNADPLFNNIKWMNEFSKCMYRGRHKHWYGISKRDSSQVHEIFNSYLLKGLVPFKFNNCRPCWGLFRGICAKAP